MSGLFYIVFCSPWPVSYACKKNKQKQSKAVTLKTVSLLQEATEALVELYGEQAPECGDAYYHYGRALLELARKEAGVLVPDLDGASSRKYCY